jgi:hypothetical protein
MMMGDLATRSKGNQPNDQRAISPFTKFILYVVPFVIWTVFHVLG